MLIGVLGGTFNPVHNGHLRVAQQACNQLNLDKLLLVPTKSSVGKNSAELAETNHRLKMLHIALKTYDKTPYANKIAVSEVDINRNSITYTYDTLTDLRAEYQDADFIFLIGDDLVENLDNWKNADKLEKMAQFVVVSRNNNNNKEKTKKTQFNTQFNIRELPIDSLPISSKMVRNRIKNDLPIEDLVPKLVAEYIEKMGFYQAKSD